MAAEKIFLKPVEHQSNDDILYAAIWLRSIGYAPTSSFAYQMLNHMRYTNPYKFKVLMYKYYSSLTSCTNILNREEASYEHTNNAYFEGSKGYGDEPHMWWS